MPHHVGNPFRRIALSITLSTETAMSADNSVTVQAPDLPPRDELDATSLFMTSGERGFRSRKDGRRDTRPETWASTGLELKISDNPIHSPVRTIHASE